MKILDLLTQRRKTGNFGENEACIFLKRNGYKILKRNYVANGYEIDIVAENSDYLVFVEVKTRTEGHENPKEPRPASSVTPEKQRKIISAAKAYIGFAHPKKQIRFDIIEVIASKDKKVKSFSHLIGAFNADTAYRRTN